MSQFPLDFFNHKAEDLFHKLIGLLDNKDVWTHSYKLRDLATALFMFGQTAHQLGHEEKAESSLLRAIKAYEDLTDGGAYETVRDFVGAYEQLALVYENESNDPQLFQSLTEEIKTMRLAARTDPLNYISEVPRALAHRAGYYVRRSKWDEARDDIDEAERIARQLLEAQVPVQDILSRVLVSKAVIMVSTKSQGACNAAREATRYAIGPDQPRAIWLSDNCEFIISDK